MPRGKWKLHEARNCFSHVVDCALAGNPQIVTRRGKEVAVVLAAAEYHQLTCAETATGFVRHLLAIPRNVRHFEPLGVSVLNPFAKA